MRRSFGLGFVCTFAVLGSGCQDFDAFATGAAGSGGGATTTGTGASGGATGSGGTTGSGGATGSGGGATSCFSDPFDSSGTTTAVFEQYAEAGTSPSANIAGGKVTFTSDATSIGGFRMKSAVALSGCYLSAEIPVYGDGVSTYLALYKSDDPLEHVQIAISPISSGMIQACVSGLIDAGPVADCQAVPTTVDGLRIQVTADSLVLEALEQGGPVGTPATTALPTWIGSTKIAFGIDATQGFGTTLSSSFEGLGGTPP